MFLSIRSYKLGILLSFFFIVHSTSAQNTYVFRKKQDWAITIGSGSLLLTSLVLQSQMNGLSQAEILRLDPKNINSLDRPATTYWSRTHSKASDGLILVSGLAYSYFLLNKKTKKESPMIALVTLQSFLLAESLANSAKLSKRSRPYVYNPHLPFEVKTKKDARLSFFSAHTAGVSSLCFSFAFARQVYIAKDKKQAGIWFAAITLPAVQGYLRVKAGSHFPTDVISGYFCGLATAYLTHRLHVKRQKKSPPIGGL